MKKLDNMMTKEKEEPIPDTSITCDCCTELPTIQLVTRENEEGNDYDDEDHGYRGHHEKRGRLLIR